MKRSIRKASFKTGLLFIVALTTGISHGRAPPRYGDSLVDAFDYMTTSSGGKSAENQGIFNKLFNFQDIYSQWIEVYGMLAQTEEYKEKKRQQNEKYGVYRSGEGTPEELMQ